VLGLTVSTAICEPIVYTMWDPQHLRTGLHGLLWGELIHREAEVQICLNIEMHEYLDTIIMN
jgi:hypothetical protein